MEQINASIRVVAIDLAKRVFQVAGEDARGEVIFEERYQSRETFADFLRSLPAGVQVLMETGPGAQAWARLLQSRGVCVRLLPAQRVAEHRSGAKNDRNDAWALLRAGRDTSIHEVPIKSPARLALQAVHRVRSGYQRRRTAVGNQIRGLLLEHGIALARGERALSSLPRVLEDATVPLPDVLRDLLAALWEEWKALAERIEHSSTQIAQWVKQEPQAQRLMTIPGIGPITGSALVCKELDIQRFASARQFAASFGLVPDQHSSGNRIRLGKMSKRGDRYIRSLLIEGAQAVLARRKISAPVGDDRLQRWLQRHGRKGAAVRLANRNLRIVWALLRRDSTYQRPGCAYELTLPTSTDAQPLLEVRATGQTDAEQCLPTYRPSRPLRNRHSARSSDTGP